MKINLKDKVALVTGGTRGAGRGIAIKLGAWGATVRDRPDHKNTSV